MTCRIYKIANSGISPYKAGQMCARLVLAGEIPRQEYFNPFEPDTKDGEDFNQGAYLVHGHLRAAETTKQISGEE